MHGVHQPGGDHQVEDRVGARVRQVAIVGALVLASVAASHELIYLLAYGSDYGVAMEMTGHGVYWTSFVVTVGLALGSLIAIAVRQFLRLHAQLRRYSPLERDESASVGALARMWIAFARVIAPAAVLVYAVQENVEAAAVSGAVPGLGVFTGDHAVALPILLAIGSFAAFVRALTQWRREILEARLLAALSRRATIPTATPTVRHIDRPILGLTVSTFHGRRAPPRAPSLN